MSFFYKTFQELYIGKQPELLEIEKLIGKAREPYMGKQYIGGAKVNSSKYMYDVNRAFESFFGFKIFSLHITPSNTKNACTYPLSYAIDIAPQFRLKKNLIADKSGFKFKKEAGYCCTIIMYSGMFLDSKFTNAEILAIIMHEIGHNFQSVLNKNLYYFTDITAVFRYIAMFIKEVVNNPANAALNTTTNLINSSNIYKLLDAKLRQIVASSPSLSVVAGMFGILNGLILDIFGSSMYILTLLTKYQSLPIAVMSSITSKILNPLAKTAENVSDSFAATYGYGPDLSSILSKIDINGSGDYAEDALYNVPVFGEFLAYYNMPFEVILTALDEHPSTFDRMNVMRNNLKHDLSSNDLDTKLRQKLEKDLEDMEDSFDEYNKLANNGTPRSYKMLWFMSFCTQDNDKVSRKVSSNMDEIFRNTRLK